MKKDSIIHFVGFVSRLKQSVFVDQWMDYSRRFNDTGEAISLQRKESNSGKYDYISQHVFNEEEFRFVFLTGRESGQFSDQKARVLSIGGYMLTETPGHNRDELTTRIIAFFNQDSLDIDDYTSIIKLPGILNIYQAFYENCLYSYIMEFSAVDQTGAQQLLAELRTKREAVDLALYTNCQLPDLVVK